MLRETLLMALSEIWPMLFIFSIILSSLRITYLIMKRKKFVLYRELIYLLFIVYILILFYIVSFQDNGFGESNFIPFTEMFRYSFGSSLFIRNIVGNLLLFIPFGIFVSYYLKTKTIIPILILAFITSLSIESTQKIIGRVFDVDDIILNITGAVIGFYFYIIFRAITKKLPKIIKREWFLNLVIILLILLLILYLFNFNNIGDNYELYYLL